MLGVEGSRTQVKYFKDKIQLEPLDPRILVTNFIEL